MPSDWMQATWGDLAVLEYGKALRGYQNVAHGDVRVFGTNGPIGWTSEAMGFGPTVIVGRKGAYRGVNYAPGAFWVIDTAYWLGPVTELNARWAYYQLLTQDINGRDSGSAIPSLSRSDFYSFSVDVPPLPEQQAIAEVLGALDDKIEANSRLVPLLRDLAKAMLQRAADRASSYLVGEVADVRKGLSYTGAGLADAGMPMVNLANAENFGWLKRSGFKYYTGPYKPRHVAQPGSLLVSGVEQTWRHEIIGWPMLLPDDIGPALFSHHVLLVDFRPEWDWLRLPLWAHLYTAEARARLEGMVYGTTVATLPTEALMGLAFPAPRLDDPAIGVALDLLRRAWAAERESVALAALRDTLLPPLVSGEIRVRAAAAAVAEVRG